MSDTLTRLLFLFIDVILPLITGYLFHKYKIISLDTCNILLKVNVRVLIAIIGFGSFWLIDIDKNIVLLVFLGFILCSAMPGIFSYPYATKKLLDIRDSGAFLIAIMLSNIGILGGLCAFIAMGQLAYAYVQVIAMAQNIFTLTVAFPLAEYFRQKYMAGSKKVKFKPRWRSILISWNQIGLVCMIIGTIFNLNHIPRPDLFDPIYNSFVHISAWVGILPTGYLLNFAIAKRYKYTSYALLPIRFILTPLICYLTTYFFTDNPLILTLSVLVGLCPVGINSIIVTQLYQLNTHVAEANFLITTALFILIIYPLFLLFML